jgi:hypothetical protein
MNAREDKMAHFRRSKLTVRQFKKSNASSTRDRLYNIIDITSRRQESGLVQRWDHSEEWRFFSSSSSEHKSRSYIRTFFMTANSEKERSEQTDMHSTSYGKTNAQFKIQKLHTRLVNSLADQDFIARTRRLKWAFSSKILFGQMDGCWTERLIK